MHPQLTEILDQLDDTERRAQALAARAQGDAWMRRPSPTTWSPSDCVQHLVTSIDAFLPLVDEVLDTTPRPSPPDTRRYSAGWLGRILLWSIEPPYRMRVRTAARFVPGAPRSVDVDLAEFMTRHAEWRSRMARADGLPLDRLRIVSPFDRRVRYSLYTTFRIVPTHERRHLWQAERVLAGA